MSDSSSPSPGSIWKALGPGILVACAAIGGSHLVWSTRAGANFGWSLLGLILIANLLKFPFFLYGQRYTAATGESLLAGYHRRGVAYVWIFLAINILTGVINIAGVGMLSGALLQGYGLEAFRAQTLTVVLIAVCAVLILVGHYKVLDGLAKVIITFLAVATFASVIAAALTATPPPEDFVSPNPYQWVHFAFLVNLLGWMPAPIDLSAWSSLWMFSRKEQTGHFASVRETSIDFYIGYIAAVGMAVLFLALGALVMHGTGAEFSPSGLQFSKQLVTLYTNSIGEWSEWLILSAAFVTMFSTTLTCVDGYPRALAASCSLLAGTPAETFRNLHRIWVLAAVVLSSVIVLVWVTNLLQLLKFAAVVSFLTSPILAFINYRVMTGDNVPASERPGGFLTLLSLAGIAFFALMSVAYLYLAFTG